MVQRHAVVAYTLDSPGAGQRGRGGACVFLLVIDLFRVEVRIRASGVKSCHCLLSISFGVQQKLTRCNDLHAIAQPVQDFNPVTAGHTGANRLYRETTIACGD